MKPVSPHDLLSAYLDGELAPREREEVERLLAESKEARQELSELEQVGELLRQIPREALPSTFASQVMDVCFSETGEFDSTTLAELPTSQNIGPNSSPAQQTETKRRGWFRAAGLTAALATVAAILIIVFPGSPETNPSEMAQSPLADESAEAERNFSEDHSEDRQNQPLAAEGSGSEYAHNQAGGSEDVGFAEAQSLEKPPSQEFSDQAKSLATPAEADAVRQSADGRMERELSVAAAEKARKAGNQQSGRVAVVKIRVPDRRQGLKELQSLLERHQIPTGASQKGQPSKDGENQLAVYVEVDSDRFSAAMEDLQKQPAFRDVTWDSPVALAQIKPMLSAPKKGFRAFRRSRAMSFGAGGAAAPKNSRIESPQSDSASARQPRAEKSAPQKESSGKPGEMKADKAEDRLPSSPQAVKAEPVPTPESAEAKLKKSPAPRITAADSNRLKKGRAETGQMKRLQTDAKPADQKGAKPANRNANEIPPARQQEFTLPQSLLKRLQDSAAKIRSRQDSSDESKQPSPAPNRGRVQVVFVLVDQDEPSENAPPADKSAPATE